MYASKLLTERSPVAKCVMIAEANTDAPKSFCDAPDGTGHRDMARSDSSARELGRSTAAKAGAEVGGNRSSVEAGNDRGAKGSCIESASNRSAGADSLRRKRMTEEEIASIAAKHRMAKFPNLALTRERLSRKAKAEPKFRFYTLYGRVVDEETIRCAWERVWKKDKAPGVDGQTFEAIERGEGGVEGFLASIQRELKAKTYRASPVKRVCREVHELTHSRNVLLPVETVVERVNRLLKGWGAFYSVGYPSRVFRKVNHYLLKRMARFLNRKSQRYYRLKFADTYYGEMTHYGLYRLAWADVRRTRD